MHSWDGLLARLCAFLTLVTYAHGERGDEMDHADLRKSNAANPDQELMGKYALAVIEKIENEKFQEDQLSKWSDGWPAGGQYGKAGDLRDFLASVSRYIIVPEMEVHKFSRTVDVGAGGRTAVMGDIHGQLWVLLPILREIREDFKRLHAGDAAYSDIGATASKLFICHEKLHYVFLGDYVDRGDRNLHTFLLLVAYKALCPKQVTLLQGNHEQSDVNRVYGFATQLAQQFELNAVSNRYDEAQMVYDVVNDFFRKLPFVATVEQAYLAMHGGLTSDFDNACYNTESPRDFTACLDYDIGKRTAWSDPSSMNGFRPGNRGGDSQTYGPDVTNRFLEKHGLLKLFRGHQVATDGIRTEEGNPKVLTIFSAGCYTGTFAASRRYSNKGGWIYVDHTPDEGEKVIVERTLDPDQLRGIAGDMLTGNFNFLELAGGEASVSVHDHRARMETGERHSTTHEVPLECNGLPGSMLSVDQRANYTAFINEALQQAKENRGENGLADAAQEMVEECGEADVADKAKLCQAMDKDSVVLEVFGRISTAADKQSVIDRLTKIMSERFQTAGINA